MYCVYCDTGLVVVVRIGETRPCDEASLFRSSVRQEYRGQRCKDSTLAVWKSLTILRDELEVSRTKDTGTLREYQRMSMRDLDLEFL